MAQNINIGPIVKIQKTDDEWKKLLSPMAYGVLRHENTERPFTDNMHDSKRAGIYNCAGCDLPSFLRNTSSTAAPAGPASGSQ